MGAMSTKTGVDDPVLLNEGENLPVLLLVGVRPAVLEDDGDGNAG